MGQAQSGQISHNTKVLLATLLTGLAAGSLFPFLVSPLLGSAALTPAFIAICLAMGLTVGGALFFFIKRTLKNSLHEQIERLKPMAGEIQLAGETVEHLQQAIDTAVLETEALLSGLVEAIDRFSPHFNALFASGRYLHDRALEGLQAAESTRKDVEAVEKKQREVGAQIEVLAHRTQDEAALSRELSASLEEMAGAIGHSNAKFLETTAAVDQMAASIREVAGQAGEISRSVEGTSQNLDRMGESLEKIRTGASASAETAARVEKDADNGLLVVKAAMEEMERIDSESQKATEAMQRLSRQTTEVAKIIEVIKELVSDTELLAFNAAIIAAKAGEEGKGFSVVAEEIRDLADRTTASAQDIQRIVKAIGGETRHVTEAVDATAMRIAKGKQLSLSVGEALNMIAESSRQAATASNEIAALTVEQGERAKFLLEDAGRSLRSIKAIARAMQEQQASIACIQTGVTQMKKAVDQIGRGMEEQVRANREFDRGLAEREDQIQAVNEAIRFQMATAQKIFAHFATSASRLTKNAEQATSLSREIGEVEKLAEQLRQQARRFQAAESQDRR